MNIFEQATRSKLRFETNKGSLSIETLWDLSLTALNNLYIELNSKVESASTHGLMGARKNTKESVELNLKLELIEHVYNARVEEIKAKEKIQAARAQNEMIDDLIAQKEHEKLQNLSIEQLQKLKATV